MIQHTIEKLRSMRMPVFAQALNAQIETGKYHSMSFEQRLTLLVEEEYIARENRRISRNLKNANLKLTAQVENVDLETKRNIRKELILELSNCTWIRKGINLLVTGPTGVGKTYLGCALAEKASQHMLSVKYFRLDDLLRTAAYAQADGTYPKLLKSLMKVNLLVLDEWLRTPVTSDTSRILADILDDRYGKLSTMCLSQFPIAQWYARFSDPTIAEAILDRIVHNARKVQIKGESMRKKKMAQEG